MKKSQGVVVVILGSAMATSVEGGTLGLSSADSTSGSVSAIDSRPAGLWQNGIGEGFLPTVQTISLEVGATGGFAILGGRQEHDLGLASVAYGHMWGSVVGEGHWYRGNWEVRGELFGGGQFSPTSDTLVGLTPHLRYNFATGTRWIPFADIGAGLSATSIGPPDLSGTFEFNLQANTGVHWFVRDKVALTFEVGYLHVSCADIHDPNLGLNCVKGMAGITWFF